MTNQEELISASKSDVTIKSDSPGIHTSPSKCKPKTLAVLTSGGDAQGMNAALRAVTRVALYHNIRAYGVFEGYQGLVDGGEFIKELTWDSVSNIIQKGGTVFGTARCMEFRSKEGRRKAAQNLIKREIHNLCVIGGDGSLTGATLLAKEFPEHWAAIKQDIINKSSLSVNKSNIEYIEEPYLNIIGIVGSIDNDMCDNDMTIGTDSALHRIVEAADSIKSTAGSHQRVFVIEVMGRRCGHLALMAALSTEADYVFLPEVEVKAGWEDEMCDRLMFSRKSSQRFNIIFVAEGAIDEHKKPLDCNRIKSAIDDRLQFDTRITVLGHVQRGGKPSAYDRVLSTRLGAEAALQVHKHSGPQDAYIIAIKGNEIVHLDLNETIEKTIAVTKAIDSCQFDEVSKLRGTVFQDHLETYMRLSSPYKQKKAVESFTIAVLHVGAPAGGQNPATCALCKLAISYGHTIYAVYDGFEGFAKGELKKLEWNDLIRWMHSGGSRIGTNRVMPCESTFKDIATQMGKFGIHALVIAGGFEGFISLLRLEAARHMYPAFRVPMLLIPCTISNNVPGSEYSLGSDTALNIIQQCIDFLKQSASASRKRVFIVEVQGANCGYLATMSALAGGADYAYIREDEFNLDTICENIRHIVDKFKRGIKRGIILRAEQASVNYTINLLENLYEAQSGGLYKCRSSILGHIQQGGAPSPFDRISSCLFANKAMDFLTAKICNSMQSSGNLSADDHDSVCVLGLIGKGYETTPVYHLRDSTDFIKRVSSIVWWLDLKVLNEILAHYKEKEFIGERERTVSFINVASPCKSDS